MIDKIDNWDSIQIVTSIKKLPVGAYVCRIKQANVEETDYGMRLAIAFDISDGEYAGYFQKEFDSNPANIKKWKGVLRQFLPKNDGSDKDGWSIAALKALITSIENSNSGYKWNWDEQTLRGKMVGITFRNEEWEYETNGELKHGWSVKPFRACSVNSVEDGTAYIPKDKPLKNRATTAPTSAPVFNSYEEEESDFPF